MIHLLLDGSSLNKFNDPSNVDAEPSAEVAAAVAEIMLGRCKRYCTLAAYLQKVSERNV